jgi:oligopeptide transport system substrate-binding protein
MAAPILDVFPERGRPRRRSAWALLPGVALVGALVWLTGGPVHAASRDSVTILGGAPMTLDPAAQGDAASAAVNAQIYESLTAFDASLTLRPALAASWDIADGGLRIVFHLRPGLAFSDGTPLTAADVVRSWLRVIDPHSPSPLAALIGNVVGATDHLHGVTTDPSTVGLHADGQDVDVRFTRPDAEFTAVVAAPTFAVVPPGGAPDGQVGSGGYVVRAQSDTELTLAANDRYWAGRPAIGTVHLLATIGGRSPVDAFTAGDLDYTPIDDIDASWIAYDRTLGTALRAVPSLSVTYLGFDVRQHPFDDVRVRRAFALAVDWRRIVDLASYGSTSPATGTTPATSMVPPGVPGRSDRDFSQHADPAQARQLLAAAGYPGGTGFPTVTYVSDGGGPDEAILRQLHDVLGVTVRYETMDFSTYFARIVSDPPAIWSLGWVADYPGPNDFLGILLGTGQATNYGRWSSAAFDAAIAAAGAAPDEAAARTAYEQAETVVHDEAPVIPIWYLSGWALSRDGLLGAADNGLGFIRFAGLAWAP